MSDFLGRLVSRNLDGASAPGAAAVRPLLPSRFEPLAPEAMPAWGETVVEETAPPPPPAHRAEAVPQPSRADIRRMAEEPLAPRPPGPPLPSPSLPPGEGGRRDKEILVREPSLLPSPGRGEGDGRGAGGEGPALASPKVVPPSPQPSLLEARRSEPAPIVPQPSPPTTDAAEHPVSPPPPTPEPRHRIEPVVRRIEVEKILAPSPPLPAPPRSTEPAPPGRPTPPTASEPARPLLQPRVPAVERNPFPVHREAPVSETVIQVTIGRIEVKATPAPKAPARERAAERTAIDLDEYLKQRARGER